MPRWLKIVLKTLGGLIALLLLVAGGLALYIYFNKQKVLTAVNAELRKHVNGSVTIGDMHPQFFKGFPNVSLELTDVLVRDTAYQKHHHTLLSAKNVDISVDARALLHSSISINHIAISNAAVDLYTDATGYSNTSVFKTNAPKTQDKSSSTDAQLQKFSLQNVRFSVTDQKAAKLFDYQVKDLSGQLKYPATGYQASLHLDVFTNSMAFNTNKGSFLKNKAVEGNLSATYNIQTGRIDVHSPKFEIGNNEFTLQAIFEKSTFDFHLTCDALRWREASNLLANNIQLSLNRFDIDQPLAVDARISGSFKGGDPLLLIKAKVKNSQISTPGGTIANCSFAGLFTNNYVDGKGLTDENSAIRLFHLNGSYQQLPFSIDTGSIINLTKPIATGNCRASFPAASLNSLFGQSVKFSKGRADINLHYRTDIVDYEINKPMISGSISLNQADFNYVPENLKLSNSSITLNFIKNDLVLNHIRLQAGGSVVNMEGRVHNFMNFYYDAPEKILLNWRISSPQLYLGEFIGFFSGGTTRRAQPSRRNTGNVIRQLSNVLQKGRAEMHLKVAKVYFHNFLATNATADLLTSSSGVLIKNVGVSHAGGSLLLNGSLLRGQGSNRLTLSTKISNVNVREFFQAFDNFGLSDFTYQNLKGTLSAQTEITAGVTDQATLLPRSINGTANVHLRNAALLNFKPLQGVGKFAFPFRDLKNISVPALDADFDIHGDMITIRPMQISSSVLNMDIAGVYGLTKGTDITMDIPLRNPKKDTTITDETERQRKRYRGIVLHLQAKADETGKIKIGFNKNRSDKSK